MTKFNPDNKKELTYGDCLGPAMKITDQDDANQYLAAYCAYIAKNLSKYKKRSKDSPLEIARHNLGYYSGYYDSETMARVQKLFCCEHPVFGTGVPTLKKVSECVSETIKRKHRD